MVSAWFHVNSLSLGPSVFCKVLAVGLRRHFPRFSAAQQFSSSACTLYLLFLPVNDVLPACEFVFANLVLDEFNILYKGITIDPVV